MPPNAPLPDNETQRLAALRQYAILDTPAEQVFDDYTFLASTICDVPIALVSLIDEHRQWFKSSVGLEAQETPRHVAFCAHTILDNQVMIVPDAQNDGRFAQNPLVTDDPAIRFYAGAPLTTPEGYNIGTLCTIDRKPRNLSTVQQTALSALARQLMGQLELRLTAKKLADSLEKIQMMDGLIPICSYCKGIRRDDGFWTSVEHFLHKHSGSDLTHGICPTCMKKHFPDIDADATDA